MINPDGVTIGNFRTSLCGKDLNRTFKITNDLLIPEVKGLKFFYMVLNTKFGRRVIIEQEFSQNFCLTTHKCSDITLVFLELQSLKRLQQGLWYWEIFLIVTLFRHLPGFTTLNSKRRTCHLRRRDMSLWVKWLERLWKIILTCFMTKSKLVFKENKRCHNSECWNPTV